jgi:divalent metal cation (Fe/Co/Zn/Cd) transporter
LWYASLWVEIIPIYDRPALITGVAHLAGNHLAGYANFHGIVVHIGELGGDLRAFVQLDPIVGLGIGAAILGIVWKSTQEIWHRIMDAVDLELHEEFRHNASHVPRVLDVHGRRSAGWDIAYLYGEMQITANCQQTTLQSYMISEEACHRLFHEMPALLEVVVHVDP